MKLATIHAEMKVRQAAIRNASGEHRKRLIRDCRMLKRAARNRACLRVIAP